NIVMDIQAKVDTLLTNLAAVQTDVDAISTDVTTIKTTTETANEKLDAVQTDVDAISTDVTTIKATTDTINQKLDAAGNGIQMLTRYNEVTFDAGTLQPSKQYTLASVTLPDENNAAEFGVYICNGPGNWGYGDYLAISSVGSIGGPRLLVKDSELAWHRCYQTRFIGPGMAINLGVGETPSFDVNIFYYYTVTTESGARMDEVIYSPP
ncbi:MAG: hypothetical protein LUQ41_08830, partial [Methanomicrobiales archaeon]|nr:hypothetical protein [Methanomicrobiales archaeon]